MYISNVCISKMVLICIKFVFIQNIYQVLGDSTLLVTFLSVVFWGEGVDLIFVVFFFHYHFVPLYPLPPAITTLLSMSMSPFSFLLSPPTP